MPGFQIAGQGQGPNSLAEVRRTHRWVFESIAPTLANQQVLLVLQKATRPNFKLEEPVMHHNQEQVYFAGKQSWEPLAMTWYDVEQSPDVSKAMWDWINKCVTITKADVAPPNQYKATVATLKMLDGAGTAQETWKIYNGWPQEVNWNALDYTSTDLQLIEVKFRFDRAVRE